MSGNDVDYGPLQGLIGEWFGDKGMDVAPDKHDIEEHNPFYETIVFEPIGEVTNAESQVIAALRYHQIVSRKSDDKVFHNQTGYWMWDRERSLVMQNLTIPRGVALVAGGEFVSGTGPVELHVRAGLGDSDWPIAQPPFLRDQASTVAFEHRVIVEEDSLQYEEHTQLEIYGASFDHSDQNSLQRR